MAKKINTEKLLTEDEIEEAIRKMMGTITSNGFPQMRLKNNGVHKDLTANELKLASTLVYNR